MGTIFKYTFKNMWAHKLRTFLLIFCIFICSLVACLCLDLSGSLELVLKSVFTELTGTADVLLATQIPLKDDDFICDIENETLYVANTDNQFLRPIDGEYAYVHRNYLNIYGIDIDKGKHMQILPSNFELADNEIAISKDFSQKFEYQEGDTIPLHDEDKKEVLFRVSTVFEPTGLFLTDTSAVVTLNSYQKLKSGEIEYNMAFIDVTDDTKIGDMKDYLKDQFPKATVDLMMEDEGIVDQIANIKNVFMTVLVICLLLVTFVTFSVSERIVIEKMSTVGTFRSLGISKWMTEFALYFENCLYGVIGVLLGSGLYVFGVRSVIFNSVFTITNGSQELDTPQVAFSPVVFFATLIFAVLLELLCSAKETIKTVKMPIRDIIFSNKDTEYRPHKASVIAGVVMTAVAVICFFYAKGFAANILCIICIVIGAALLFGVILKGVSALLTKAFSSGKMPIAQLAAREFGSKKSTVGSATLCVTASALSMVILTAGIALFEDFDSDLYHCDVIVNTDFYTKTERFSYIEDLEYVEGIEYIYMEYDSPVINGEELSAVEVYGFKDGGFEYYNDFSDVKGNIRDDEIIIDKITAKNQNIHINDKINVKLNTSGFMPIEKSFTVKGMIQHSMPAFLVSENVYKSMFRSLPTYVLAKTNQPNHAKEVKEKIEKYSSDDITEVQTIDEYHEKLQKDNASVLNTLYVIIVVGIGLTFIGATSGQLIGFDGRKRECAVLLSTAMGRGKLGKLFLIESFFAAGTAVICALPISFMMIQSCERIFEALNLGIALNLDFRNTFMLMGILWIVFTFISLFPIRAMKKMNISEQLKYE